MQFEESCKDVNFISKSGLVWQKHVPFRKKQQNENIIKTKPGPNYSKTICSIIDTFFLFMSDEIIESIVTYTNQKGELYFSNKREAWKPTNTKEIYALFGILITMGALDDSHESVQFLWSENTLYACPFYSTVMPRVRFIYLLAFLRFDDYNTRLERRSTDKLAPIRAIVDTFITNCTNSFNPSSHLTVDEQLVPFRGKCPFKVYMKSKPAKYGIKIWTLCDTEHVYVKNFQIYTGKVGNVPEKDQGKRVVLDLVEC